MIHAFAQHSPCTPLSPYDYTPGPLGPNDIEIQIEYCGLCHSDLHLIEGDWPAQYPLVPGHEIVGRVLRSHFKNLPPGTRVGVGWQCGACFFCDSCLQGKEASCPSKIRTCVNRPGGFADRIIIDQHFAYPLPKELDPKTAAPLLCAGITAYSPLRAHINATQSVAIIGIGGIGHLALQFARAFGASVTAISTSPEKEKEALKFGAHHFLLLNDLRPSMPPQFDFILSTVHADIDWGVLLDLLKPSGKLCCVGIPQKEIKISARQLITNNRSLCGSSTGSRFEMREMLQFAARHSICPQVEILPLSQINEAIAKLKRNEARYRLVLAQENR